MFEMSKKLQDKGLFFRLNEITKRENAVKKGNKKMKASAIHYQKLKYCIVLYSMYFLLIWRKRSSTNRSLIKAK